jgi:SHS2 domain-containing protein
MRHLFIKIVEISVDMQRKQAVRKKQGAPGVKKAPATPKAMRNAAPRTAARVSFEFLPDVATADLAFKAYGADINELFSNSALAVCDATVERKTVGKKRSVEIRLEADTLENLLFDFLSEIVYRKDVDQVVFADCKASVKEKRGVFKLHATLRGEKIDRKRHNLRSDIKAITLHMFSITKRGKGFEAQVVVDI